MGKYFGVKLGVDGDELTGELMDDENDGPPNFYVYCHYDKDGTVFYIGKGTGQRAWSKDRHSIWHKYVDERLNGEYTVGIVEDELTENEAYQLEAELIEEYGENLVNWVNPARGFDDDALDRYHELRGANLKLVMETKGIEKERPSEAIETYYRALAAMREYESLETETGLVAELTQENKSGDVEILDRITLLLVRQKRYQEAHEVMRKYFEDFPRAAEMTVGKRVRKRVTNGEGKSNG